jgi:hypothetical protein
MYQPSPSGNRSFGQSLGQSPQSILTAVKLMYAGAAITTVSFVVSLATIGGTKSAIRRQYPHYTAHQVSQLAGFIVVLAVVSGIIGIALWLWMAQMTGKGRSWARIVSTVLFGLDTLDMLGVLREPKTFTVIFPIFTWLVGLGAIVFLWQRTSSEYFERAQGFA